MTTKRCEHSSGPGFCGLCQRPWLGLPAPHDCTWGTGREEQGGQWHCDECCPKDCEDHPTDCEACGETVMRSETSNREDGRICVSCIEKEWEEHERMGRQMAHAYESEKFYREEGLLREDGTWDLPALLRLKRAY